jgi:hypothetical protein
MICALASSAEIDLDTAVSAPNSKVTGIPEE